MAMEALRSLWLSSCAPAVELRADARTQPNVSAPERSVDRNILLLPNCSHAMRQGRKYSGILGINGRLRGQGHMPVNFRSSCVDGPRLARENVASRTEVACSHVSRLLTP